MTNRLLAAFAVTSLILLSACGDGVVRGPEKREPSFVGVKLQPTEEPPTGAEVYIRIIEVTGPDRALVGTFKGVYGLPEYRVEYRKGRIRDEHSYALEIVVMAEGKPVMQNRKPYFVITKGHPDHVVAEVEKR